MLCFILLIDDDEFMFGEIGLDGELFEFVIVIIELCVFVIEVCCCNVDILIFLYGEMCMLCYLLNDILCELYGFIYMFEDMLEFVVCYIICEVKVYFDLFVLLFFKEFVKYVDEGLYLWYCLGYLGGVVFLKNLFG